MDVRTTKAEEGLPTSDFQLPVSDFLFPTSDLTALSGLIATRSAMRVLMFEGKAHQKEQLYRYVLATKENNKSCSCKSN